MRPLSIGYWDVRQWRNTCNDDDDDDDDDDYDYDDDDDHHHHHHDDDYKGCKKGVGCFLDLKASIGLFTSGLNDIAEKIERKRKTQEINCL